METRGEKTREAVRSRGGQGRRQEERRQESADCQQGKMRFKYLAPPMSCAVTRRWFC